MEIMTVQKGNPFKPTRIQWNDSGVLPEIPITNGAMTGDYHGITNIYKFYNIYNW